MKAITLWQPWGTLWAADEKFYETRSWATSYRGLMAIHAAARSPKLGVYTFNDAKSLYQLISSLKDIGVVPEEMPNAKAAEFILRSDVLPTGAVIGQGDLIGCHLIDEAFVSKLSEKEKMFGDFTLGRYAWEMRGKELFENPIPVKGGQRIWNWERRRAKDVHHC